MKTYCFLSKSRKGAGFTTQSIFTLIARGRDKSGPYGRGSVDWCRVLCGVLISLQCIASIWLPSVAFASSTDSGFPFGTSQALDRAGVSVVRLLVTYTSVPPCVTKLTGLGVLVGSWATTPGSQDFTDWVLTDGSVVNPNGISCSTGKVTEALASIQIVANTAYISSGLILKTLQCHATSCTDGTTSAPIQCALSPSCEKDVVLLPFHTATPQPFIDMPPTDQAAQSSGIELAGSSSLPPNFQQAPQFLRPSAVSSNQLTNPNNDLGMPIVNSNGQLLDMNTRGFNTGASIRDFVITQLTPLQQGHTNPLHDAWDQGVSNFYANNFSTALGDFTTAGKPNPQFQAPTAFLKQPQFKSFLSATATASAARTPITSGTPVGAVIPAAKSINVFGYRVSTNDLVNLALIAIAAILGIIVLLVLLLMLRRWLRQRREYAKLDRIADEDAARIRKEEEEYQKTQQESIRQYSPVNASAAKNSANMNAQLKPNLRCPNCQTPVQPTDNFCSNCRSPLTLSDSGLNVRLAMPPAQVPSSPPAPSQGPATVPSQQGLTPSGSIYDEPTQEMSPSNSRNGQEELEKTLPFTVEEISTRAPVERYSGHNMSLLVGTRSNPGIKRQHKPNEDSLFAAQGERTLNSQAQQFGLFVVADGMGGHANGQDASRLAIQTISETILPKLSSNEPLGDDALVQLLLDGVQSANLAVHQRNMEHRADMGTTMTAALIVEMTAYIANVGDSRTYLYRKPGGLKKITNDHSVVASLVEAGIIKPDDIYTHPKRNQIYRSLGEKPVVDVDSFKVPLEPGDKLLLCSDGLWDMVRDPAIEQVLSAVPDPSQTGNALIKAALDGGGEDNVSVIVVSITEATRRTGLTGVQLLARPEAPQWPPM